MPGRPAVKSHTQLEVYKQSFAAAMEVFRCSKQFPTDERYSLTDQIRRSSRSIAANLAEAWRRRRYEAAFVSKLNECEAEAAETQVWLHFAVECEYLNRKQAIALYKSYDAILKMLVAMISNPTPWILPVRKPPSRRATH